MTIEERIKAMEAEIEGLKAHALIQANGIDHWPDEKAEVLGGRAGLAAPETVQRAANAVFGDHPQHAAGRGIPAEAAQQADQRGKGCGNRDVGRAGRRGAEARKADSRCKTITTVQG